MKTLELFAGSRSFSKVAEKHGFKTYTTDNQDFDKIDQVCDIFDFDIDKAIDSLGGKPNVIWASPPCTFFSVASIGHHWNKDHTPKTEQAKLGVRVVNNKSNAKHEISCTGAFIAIGHIPNTKVFDPWLDMDETGYIVNNPGSSKTNIEGVFVSGDAADHVYRQAVTAAGTGCMAALDAERYLAAKGLH